MRMAMTINLATVTALTTRSDQLTLEQFRATVTPEKKMT